MADGQPKRVKGIPKAKPQELPMCAECGEHQMVCSCEQCGAGICAQCTAPSGVREVCEGCWDPEVDGGGTDHD